MKKIALYSVLALCLGFTACDGYEEPNPPAQQNPQEAIFKTEDLTFAPTAQAGQVINLGALNDENQSADMATITLKDFPEQYTLNVVMEVAADQSFKRAAEVPTTIVDDVVKVAPDAFQGAYTKAIGKSPKEKEIYVRYIAYAERGTSKLRIGGPEYAFGATAVKVLPIPSSNVIEDNYYLLGTINGWSVATAVKFNHSDANVYDDPVFTLKVDISDDEAAAGWWWKIIPESTYATGDWVGEKNGCYGVEENGSEALEGMLVGRTHDEDCGAGCLKTAGQLLLTINMEEGTYEFTSAVDYLYTPGNSNGWNQANSQRLFTYNYADYMGFAHLNGEFKFTNAPDWSHINYGYETEEESDGAWVGTLGTSGDAKNLNAPFDALYWVKVNTASLSFSIVPINTVGLIGDFTDSWSYQLNMTPSADFLTWTATDVQMTEGQNWKFRMNDNWGINLGGVPDELTPDGANIVVEATGTYDVTIQFATLPYTFTIVKK